MADFSQSILRRLRDLSSNPRQYLEMLADRLDNFNKGRVAEIRPSGAGYRTLTPRERSEQITSGALENIGSGGMGALGVIKQKGGNWLTGSVEKALERLKRGIPHDFDVPLDVIADRLQVPISKVQDVMRKDRPRYDSIWEELWKESNPSSTALNKWIEGPLTKYVKRDMATPGDPVRALAEQGILHINPEAINPNMADAANRMRKVADSFVRTPDIDSPGTVLSKSPLARVWEDVSDSAVGTQPVGVRKRYEFQLKDSPWMADLPDETLVHHYNQSNDIGFSHLVDELKNALNPESGLPRNLLLTPEQMQQLGMEKAVRHVDAINKWRAEQQAIANLAKSQSPAVHLFKEYAENNPKGLRWVELKAPEDLPKGWELGKPTAFGEPTYRKSGSSDDVMNDPRRQLLQDQLKYEGDTMGHCVGGYCEDVIGGKSRIYSLRDAKGEPHVTIEVGQPLGFAGKKSREEYENFIRNLPDTRHTEEEIQQALKDLDDGGAWDERIIQIKGKANLAPKADYLPFVQDFVKSGKWGKVDDIQNTGLVKVETTDGVQYLTPEEFETLKNAIPKPGYAEGGLVRSPSLSLYSEGGIISNVQR